MFATPAFAATGGTAGGSGAGFFVQIFPLILIFVIFYFLLIRPQQRRMKQHRQMVDDVKPRDTAITSGGLIGKVTKVDETEVEIELGTNVKVRAIKATLAEVRPLGGAKPAND